ncbi:MAG: alpha-glucan family phosphorylase, partial [Candidatus Pacebacteria bacterium]|nr:alpha-glucan family phosphorylase [Candidatus Paceibacterota bacterium]
RLLVGGVDIWLNNPRRPMEASGTSGMKAQFNGCINISTFDGWWCEAYNGKNGWVIGNDETVSDDKGFQDNLESKDLYNILEKEVVPRFYERGTDGIPKKWVKLMKSAMTSICPIFNTNRMVKEYYEKFYFPASQRSRRFMSDEYKKAKELRSWKKRLRKNWNSISILNVNANKRNVYHIDEDLPIQADIRLGNISPKEVSVEVYYGKVTSSEEMSAGGASIMQIDPSKTTGDGKDKTYHYTGTVNFTTSGQSGISIRILPKNDELINKYLPGLILWASDDMKQDNGNGE